MSAAPDGRPWTRFLADWPGSPIEWLAGEAGLTYGELSMYLVREVHRRRQARYAMHTHAYEQLDPRLERVAVNGDSPEHHPDTTSMAVSGSYDGDDPRG